MTVRGRGGRRVASRRDWRVAVWEPRVGSRSRDAHEMTAKRLGVAPRTTIEATIAAYVAGEDGRPVRDQGQRIDPVLAAMCAHLRIRPLRLLRADHLGLGFRVKLVHGRPADASTGFNDMLMPDIGGTTHIAGASYAHSRIEGGRLTLPHDAWKLPRTLVASLTGRPLSDLIHLPALDGRQPRIIGIQPGDACDRLVVEELPTIPCLDR